MELTVQNVYGLLLRSRLLAADDARAMFARWHEEAQDGAGNTARFAAWMVSKGYLTEYQAALLARGHAEGFFLGEYKVLDRRGKGRMAGVYKAQHRLGQIVAIKVLPPSKAREPNLLGRFQREAKLAMRLQHPNIVRTFQVGTAKDVYYLVMEYLEGETLDELLARRRRLPPAEAVRLIHQALLGLQHVHQRGMVHRDLKPANIMLVPDAGATNADTSNWTLKILDIGLARSLFEEGDANADQLRPADPSITDEGVILGTPDYMAPEQARDARAADIRSDIYSLGCVLFHLIAGQPPFPDTNIISQMIRHATETPKPLATFNPEVPDGLQQIVNWMMAKDPQKRYPTPERAAEALQVFLAVGADATPTGEDERLSKYLVWLERQDVRPVTPADVELMPATAPAIVAAPTHPESSGRQQRPAGAGAVQSPAKKPLVRSRRNPLQRPLRPTRFSSRSPRSPSPGATPSPSPGGPASAAS